MAERRHDASILEELARIGTQCAQLQPNFLEINIFDECPAMSSAKSR